MRRLEGVLLQLLGRSEYSQFGEKGIRDSFLHPSFFFSLVPPNLVRTNKNYIKCLGVNSFYNYLK